MKTHKIEGGGTAWRCPLSPSSRPRPPIQYSTCVLADGLHARGFPPPRNERRRRRRRRRLSYLLPERHKHHNRDHRARFVLSVFFLARRRSRQRCFAPNCLHRHCCVCSAALGVVETREGERERLTRKYAKRQLVLNGDGQTD